MSPREIRPVYDVVRASVPCNFLVFGLGDDSPMWTATNYNGHTLFIEDDREWIDRMLEKEPDLNLCFSEYKTARRNWDRLLDKPEELGMELPASIRNREWELIPVNAVGLRTRSTGSYSEYLHGDLISSIGYPRLCARHRSDCGKNLQREVSWGGGMLKI